MAFKMKAGSEGPMKKNFPGAFKKDPIRTKKVTQKTHGKEKVITWTNPLTGKTRTKVKTKTVDRPEDDYKSERKKFVTVEDSTYPYAGTAKFKQKGRGSKSKEVYDEDTLEVKKRKGKNPSWMLGEHRVTPQTKQKIKTKS